MRKVLFKKFIPIVWVDPDGNEGIGANGRMPKEGSCFAVHKMKVKPGTNQWEDDFTHPGLFHEWGNESEDTGEEIANDTYAIIELHDGTIEMVLPRQIKFIEPYEPRPVVRGEDIKRLFKSNPLKQAQKI